MCPPACAPALGHSVQHPPGSEGSLDELWDTLSLGLGSAQVWDSGTQGTAGCFTLWLMRCKAPGH